MADREPEREEKTGEARGETEEERLPEARIRYLEVKYALKLMLLRALTNLPKVLAVALFFAACFYVWEWYFVADVFLALPIAYYVIKRLLHIDRIVIASIDLKSKRLLLYKIPRTFSVVVDPDTQVLTFYDNHMTDIFFVREAVIDKVNQVVYARGYYDTSVSEFDIIVTLRAYADLLERYGRRVVDVARWKLLFAQQVLDFHSELFDRYVLASIRHLRRTRLHLETEREEQPVQLPKSARQVMEHERSA